MLNGKKVLLVLGGLAQQCDIIRKAKEDGYYVIVTDYLDDSPGKKIAHESYSISITDVNEIIKLCKKRNVDGVMNYCIDPGQKPYQRICEKLKLPCYGTKEQFEVLTNKDLFYETCKKYDVDVVPRFQISNHNNLNERKKIEYPVIIKPVDGRASKGITLCRKESELNEAINHALSYSKRNKIIFEKYMDRPELCVKYFVVDGEIFLTSMADIYSYHENGERVYFNGQFFPSEYYSIFKKQADKKLRNMIKGLNIKNGPLSFSGFFDEGKFRFVDPSFRMGGAQDWRIVNNISGIDISRCMTNYAIYGSMGDVKRIKKIDNKFSDKNSIIYYLLARPGEINEITGIEEIINLETVIGYHMTHNIGDEIKNYGTSDHVIMRFLMVSNVKQKLLEDYLKIQESIKVFDIKGENMVIPAVDLEAIHNF